jgi:hypothetical protein
VVDLRAQDFKTVHDGVEYAELTRTISGLPVRMNLLRLDLSKVRLDVVHATGFVIGVGPTSSIAHRYGAIAAINAGFFRLDTSTFAGDPAGIFQVDGKLLSEATQGRVALLIQNSASSCTKCRAPKMLTNVSIAQLKTFAELWSEGRRANISGINRQLKENELVLYTPEFGSMSPPSENSVIEAVVQNKRITRINETLGSSVIPRNGFVLTASGSKRAELLAAALKDREGLIITGSLIENPETSGVNARMAFTDVEDIVGGVPQLIKNGKIDITWEQEKASKSFVETRHPRTAVAKLKDRKFLMITVDGRSESSGGLSLYDLAALLLEFGAVDAMNLDGGGSTTMYLDGNVVNKPSDKEGERKVSDAIIVTARGKSTQRRSIRNK